MLITLTPHRAVLALGAAMLLSSAPIAYAADYNSAAAQPALQTSATTPASDANGISHITGGIGEDERDAIEAARADYNVHITNTNKDGAFNDSTELTITDKSGTALVTADAGPLFYVSLPPGSYTIHAQHRDLQQQKKIKVTKSKKAQPDIHFVW